MKRLTYYVVATFLLLLFSSERLYSQTTISNDYLTSPLDEVKYVFGEDWVRSNKPMVDLLVEARTNRVSLIVVERNQDDKYPKLSTFPVLNKLNPAVTALNFAEFDPQTFNPFTYQLDFASDKTQMIRVDNTEFVLIIQPIKR